MRSVRILAGALATALILAPLAAGRAAVPSPTPASLRWSWANPLPQGNDLEGVTYGGGRYVAVGAAGAIVTSADGSHWQTAPGGTAEDLRGVTYGAGQFVAVGAGGTVLRSTDGTAWTVVHSGGADLAAVAYGDGEFMAVGSQGAVLTSTDGTAWAAAPSAGVDLTGVAFGAGTWVAVGAGIFTSPSGSSWTQVAVPGGPPGGSPVAITFAAGRFVTVADGGGDDATVGQSTDGTTWTFADVSAILCPQSGCSLTGIAWNGTSFFVAGGVTTYQATQGAILSSPDAVNWMGRAAIAGQVLNAIACDPAGACAGVGADGALAYGQVQQAWTGYATGTGEVSALADLDGMLVAVGDAGIATSPDGVNWQSGAAPAGASLSAAAYGDGTFVAVGADAAGCDDLVLTSTDARTWTPTYTAPPAANGSSCDTLDAVAYGNGRFVAAGGGALLSSPDGVHWTATPSSGTAADPVTGLTYAQGLGLFVAVASPYVLTSPDGQAWSSVRLPNLNAPAFAAAVAYGAGRVVVGGVWSTAVIGASQAAFWTSTDGVTWSGPIVSSALDSVGALAYGPQRGFAAVAGTGSLANAAGTVLTSPDGLTWSAVPVPGADLAVAYIGAALVTGTFSQTGQVELFGAFPSFGQVAPPVTVASLAAVAASPGGLVALGFAGGASAPVVASPDGAHWSATSSLAVNFATVWGVVYGAGGFVASAGGLLTSPDGARWTVSTRTYSTLTALAYGGGRYVGMGNPGNVPTAVTSADGTHWSGTPLPFGACFDASYGIPGGYALAYGAGTWVAALACSFEGFGQTTYILTSSDAVHWRAGATLPGLYATGLAFGAGTFVLVGLNYASATPSLEAYASLDGSAWAPAASVPAADFASSVSGNEQGPTLAYGGGVFLAVGGSGAAVASADDGRTWSQAPAPTSDDLTALTYFNGSFVAVGRDGAILLATPSAGPSISSLSPASGPVGTSLAIMGSGFGTVAGVVYFSQNGATVVQKTISSWTDGQVVTAVPQGLLAGTVAVAVGVSGGGESGAASFSVVAAASGAPAALGFAAQPPAYADGPFTVAVAVYGAQGQVLTGNSDPLEIEVVPAGGSQPVAGPVRVQAAAGVATFAGVTLPPGGGFYQVEALDLASSLPPALSTAVEAVQPTLLFSDSAGQAALWGTTLPAPGQGGDGGQSFPFGGVQFTVPYEVGDHVVLAGDPSGAAPFCVDGTWELDLSGPSSQTLRGSGCSGPVDLAGQSLPPGTYGARLILATPTSGTQYGAGDVYLVTAGAANFWMAPITLPGASLTLQQPAPLAVDATATLPVTVAYSPAPIIGIHSEATWDPSALAVTVTPAAGGSGAEGGRVVAGHTGFLMFLPNTGGGSTAFQLQVTCRRPGTWPVAFAGTWWGNTPLQPLSADVSVTCAAPPAGPAAAGAVSVDAADGTLEVTVTGSGLAAAASAVLVDPSGATVASTTDFALQEATDLTARFGITPAGLDTLKVYDAAGTLLASTPHPVAVPPALPIFSLQRVDALDNVPGATDTHIWELDNQGSVDGVAVLYFAFPSYFTTEPQLFTASLPRGSALVQHGQTPSGDWYEYVLVPVAAGQAVDIPWRTVLDPNAVFGPDPSVAAGAAIPLPTAVIGAATEVQWQGVAAEGVASAAATLVEDGLGDLSAALSDLDRNPTHTAAYLTALAAADPALAQAFTERVLWLQQIEAPGGGTP